MNKKLIYCLCRTLILLLLWTTGIVFAQEFTVTGTITDQTTGEPLPAVNILVKGTQTGTISGVDGNYSITVPGSDAVLVFSFVGYTTLEEPVNGRSRVDVVMEEDILALEELVVIGYGTQKKSDLTGSVTVVDVEEMSKMATHDVTKALQGKVPGVSVQSGGEPGASPQVQIRGIGTFGNNDPLYIIDGVVAPIQDFPLSQIETIQVLKDASASAIYGSRAANGVVIITTRRGTPGKLKVDYQGYYGIQNVTGRYDVLKREQYQMLVNEACINAGEPLVLGNDPNSPEYIDDIDTDWQEEALTTGGITEHTLNISGGTENSTFHTALSFFDQTGTMEGPAPRYTRYSITVNSDHKKGRFSFGESIHYTYADQVRMTHLHVGNPIWDMVKAIPTMPVYDENRLGGYGGADNQIHKAITLNVIGVNNLLEANTVRNRFLGNVYGDYEFFEGLNYNLSVSYERVDWRDFYFVPEYDLGWFFQNTVSKLDDWRGFGFTGTLEQTLTFDRLFGDHHITAMVGNTVLDSQVKRMEGHAEELPRPYSKTLSNGTSGISVTSWEGQNRLLSYFGRVIYDYDNRYYLTATLRRDGSSRFSEDYRWGNFPSVALAWKVHNESFMRDNPTISQLKLRFSYGVLGNQEIGNYLYSTYVNPYAHAVFNGILAPGIIPLEFGTPDIRWEEKKSTNLGVDMAFMNNRIYLTAEYYDNTTDDMLVSVPIPESTGVYNWKSPTVNGASIRNRGFEFNLGYRKSRGEFTFDVSGNLSTLNNEVLSLGYGDRPIYGTMTRTAVGSEVGQFYGFIIDGIFQTQDEIDALNAASPTGFYQLSGTAPGDFKFRDTNGRNAEGELMGEPDGKIDDDDRTYLGSAIPDVMFGFNLSAAYRTFDFTVSAHGVAGNMILNTSRGTLENGGGYNNMSTRMLDRWTPTNTDTDVPRVVIGDPNQNARASARFLEPGDYLKIDNVQLGYTLPDNLTGRVGVSGIRVYFQAQNLITFTKYTGFDPDFGYDVLWDRGVDHPTYANKPFTRFMGGLPNPRTLMAGVQVSF